MRREIEALLFASGQYMHVSDMAEILERDEKSVREGLELLKDEYESDDTALTFLQANDAWKMGVKPAYAEVVQSVVADTELPTPVLETLAVIAWKRPILQSEVVDMRGSGAYDHIKQLVNMGFIDREQHKRTYKLKLSEKFFEYFDVHGEDEIREVFEDVEPPEPEVEPEEDEDDEQEIEPPKPGRQDPLEQRRVAQEELDELDEELDELSESAEQSIEELDELTKEEREEAE